MSAGLKAIKASGGSMGPRYAGVEAFLVRPAQPFKVKAGAIVVLERGGQLMAHRLMGRVRWKGRRWLVTRGDGNTFIDPPWPIEAESSMQEALAMQKHGEWVRLDSPIQWFIGKYCTLCAWGLVGLRLITFQSLYGT